MGHLPSARADPLEVSVTGLVSFTMQTHLLPAIHFYLFCFALSGSP